MPPTVAASVPKAWVARAAATAKSRIALAALAGLVMSALGLGAALDGLRARRFGVRVAFGALGAHTDSERPLPFAMNTTSSQGRDSIAITTSEPLLTPGQVAPPRRAQPRGDPPRTGPNGHSASVDV
jgi:hypothetical protein